jgi:hypothetical protein
MLCTLKAFRSQKDVESFRFADLICYFLKLFLIKIFNDIFCSVNMSNIFLVKELQPRRVIDAGINSVSFVLKFELHEAEVFTLLKDELLGSSFADSLSILEHCLDHLIVVFKTLFG